MADTQKTKPKKKGEFKRRNRNAPLGDLIGSVIDPVLRKRGFASTEILAQWAAIAPAPYDRLSIPEKISWSRTAEAGTLHLQVTAGQKLLATHDAPQIIGAVNQFFGYVLVEKMVLSKTPFTSHSAKPVQKETEANPEILDWVSAKTQNIEDEGLKAALEKWGTGIAQKSRKRG